MSFQCNDSAWFWEIILLILFPLQLSGQINLSGTVLDSVSNDPVVFAAVYIDQTTTGTITDSAGHFSMKAVNYPCKVIVSHISYFTSSFIVDRVTSPDTLIFLVPKDVGVGEITVKNKNLRDKNMRLFKERFLGDDKWGHHAKIENEETLEFRWDYDTIQWGTTTKSRIKLLADNHIAVQQINDSTFRVPDSFRVFASEPLRISLPLTGYQLQYDMVEFTMRYEPEMDFIYWKYLGYSFYKPITPGSNSELFRLKRNRLNVYYNSQMHFFRSLYYKKLRQNGYVVVEKVMDGSTGEVTLKSVDPDNWIYKDNMLQILGEKGRDYYIMYYTNINGEPLNLEKRSGLTPEQSQMYFLSDLCIVYPNGTNHNYSILFTPFMGSKQIGASLPSDFKPGVGKL